MSVRKTHYIPKSWSATNFHDYNRQPKEADPELAVPQKPLPVAHPASLFSRCNCSYLSITSSVTSIMDEKQVRSLPQKRYNRLLRNVRYTWFSVYRRLCLLVLLPNILAAIVLASCYSIFSLPLSVTSTAVSVNLTAAILIRQELVINLLFAAINRCPRWAPLQIRRSLAKIYHLGGVHSGAGIAGTIWYIIFNVHILVMWSHDRIPGLHQRSGIVALTTLIDCLLIAIVMFAMPWFRARFHNTFELIHRLAGWTAVSLLWVHFFLLAHLQWKSSTKQGSFAQFTGQSPTFWCLLIITISLVLPWLRLRKVPVGIEPLSHHAIRLHFNYTNLPLCSSPRISDSPLKEWHAFAGIPERNGEGFSIIVSKAGDWTSKIIKTPPKFLWVRGIPTRGLLHIAPIFKKLVLVTTGSGIGPVLSLLTARGVDCRLIWVSPNPGKTFNQEIIHSVLEADPRALIIDTSTSGRPDLVQEAHDLYTETGAEAIFVISNPKVTRKVVYGLESRGLPAFAPVFDS